MGTITVLKSYQAHRTDGELGRSPPDDSSDDVLSRRAPPRDLVARAQGWRWLSAAEVDELWHEGERLAEAEAAQQQIREEVSALLSRLRAASGGRDRGDGDADSFSRTISQNSEFLGSILRSRPGTGSDGAAAPQRDA